MGLKNEKKKNNKSAIFELIAYIISGALMLWGLVYIVLGLVATYMNVIPSKNELLKASDAIKSAFGLGFFGWGLIILSIGAVLCVTILCIFSRKADRELDREARRAARRNRLVQELSSPVVNETPAPVVDVPAEPVKEEPVEEKKEEPASDSINE